MATESESVDPEPFEEQEPFLWDTQRYYTYASGVGSGKTAVGLMRAATNVDYWNEGYMGAIVAPTSTMIKNAIFPLMREFGIRDKWEYKSPQSEEPGFHAPNGSRILILSADNDRTIERLAGLNLSWFWVDEARDVPERALQILIQRLRKGNYKNGFLTSTPRKNHLEEFALDGVHTEYQYGKATVHEADDRLTITGVTPDVNPYVSEEDIKAIRDAHPDGLLQQEVEGQFVDVGGGLLTRDMLSYVSPQEVPERSMDMYIGVDIGVQADAQKARQQDSDYWAAAVLAVDPVHQDGYLVDLRRQRGMALREGLQWLKGIHKEADRASVLIESNQAQRWFAQEAQDIGLPVQEVYNQENKEDRLVQLSIPFSNETIQLIDWGDDRFQPFVNEWLAFPDGTHDDALDCVEIVVDNSPVDTGQTQILTGDMYNQNDED